MNDEILRLRGRLAAAEKRFTELDNLASGLIINVRQMIDPYVDDVTTLRVDEAQAMMTKLHETVHEMRTVKAQISLYKEALGE
jgi:hypothetical protein